jgi:tetratricopeptide (TPR) repeat protein
MGFTNQGSHAQAIDLFHAALAMAREKGDKPGLAGTLNLVAGCFYEMGELERSKDAIEEALAIHTELGAYGVAAADLGTLADIALAQGDHKQAERHSIEALEVISGHGDERNELYSVAQLACVAALRADARSAGRLWAVAEATENRLRMRMIAVERARYERIITPLQDDQAFQAGYQAGREVELAETVRELRELSESG